MDKDFLIKLTLAVYRVTELFPEKEPLKFSIREKANQILTDGLLIFSKNPVSLAKEQEKKVFEQVSAGIEVLQGYLEVAQGQHWLKDENFLVLKKEYDKMREEINGRIPRKEAAPPGSAGQTAKESAWPLRNERCGKILETLKQKEKAQIWEFKKIFPEVTKRTLRRDFEYLLAKGLVERMGDGKWTFYKLNRTLVQPTDGSRTETEL